MTAKSSLGILPAFIRPRNTLSSPLPWLSARMDVASQPARNRAVSAFRLQCPVLVAESSVVATSRRAPTNGAGPLSCSTAPHQIARSPPTAAVAAFDAAVAALAAANTAGARMLCLSSSRMSSAQASQNLARSLPSDASVVAWLKSKIITRPDSGSTVMLRGFTSLCATPRPCILRSTRRARARRSVPSSKAQRLTGRPDPSGAPARPTRTRSRVCMGPLPAHRCSRTWALVPL